MTLIDSILIATLTLTGSTNLRASLPFQSSRRNQFTRVCQRNTYQGLFSPIPPLMLLWAMARHYGCPLTREGIRSLGTWQSSIGCTIAGRLPILILSFTHQSHGPNSMSG